MNSGELQFGADICTTKSNRVRGEVAVFVEASIAESTRRAYRSDWDHFITWGGQLPAEPSLAASYLATHAETLSVATLVRRIATISTAHEARGLPNPCRSEVVRATMRGVKPTRGIAQREAKPLLREDLFRVLDTMGEGEGRATVRCFSQASPADSGDRKSLASIATTLSTCGKGSLSRSSAPRPTQEGAVQASRPYCSAQEPHKVKDVLMAQLNLAA